MPPVGYEPTISAGERRQTYALDRAATGTGTYQLRGDIVKRLITQIPPFFISVSVSRI